jgi:predicted permease
MTWCARLLKRRQAEDQLQKELRFHLDQLVDDLTARGHSPEEAKRQAGLAFGGLEPMKESARDARGTRWLEDLMADVAFAVRTFANRPGFAAVSLVTLALGIGATTAIFTLVNGVLLKPLAYAHPERLINLQEKTDWSTAWGNVWAFTYPNYLDCRNGARSLEVAAMHEAGGGILSAPGDAAYVDGLEISSNLFDVLGVSLLHGRSFSRDEDRPGAAPVVIIGHRFWQRRFGGDPHAIGMRLAYAGVSRTVIGIAPATLRVDASEVDLFTPIGQDTTPMQLNRERHGTVVWARLRPGVTLAQANAELSVIGRQLETAYPKSNHGRTFFAEPLRPDVGDVRSTLWLLLGAVSLVLMIACANIASLLLARAVSRQRELAMRAALGASRGRLIRQSLTESTVLGIGGGVLGLLFAALVVRIFVSLWPHTLPRAENAHIEAHVLLFAALVSVLSGLVCGAAPALRTLRGQLDKALRSGARTVVGSSRHLHTSFVVVQLALAVVLLTSAAMLGRTLLFLSSLNPGLRIENVAVARVALSADTLASPGRTRGTWKEILDHGQHAPGVESIAMIDTVPMREGSNPIGYRTSAATLPENQQPMVLANCTTPDYLKTVGIPLLRGRFLEDRDRKGSESVAVIDELMAKQAFPGRDPIGKHLWIDVGPDPVTVIGVVGHVRQWGLAGDDHARIRAQLYYPFSQVPDQLVRRWSELMSIVVRTSTDTRQAINALKHAVSGSTNNQVLYQTQTMKELASTSLERQRFLLILFGAFAGFALILGCIGIYGVLSYLTGQRVPEIGVRMALGATARQVIALVLRQSLVMILAGLLLGCVGAITAMRVLQWLVEGMQSMDALTAFLTLAVLIGTAFLASFLPARRASRIDPIRALRQE